MRPDRRAARVAGGSVAAMLVLCLWAFVYDPELGALWLVPLTAVVPLWAMLAWARTRGDTAPRPRAPP
mgnify:CR=1 FL=1